MLQEGRGSAGVQRVIGSAEGFVDQLLGFSDGALGTLNDVYE